MKKIFIWVLVAISLLFSACSNRDTISVYSTDYVNIDYLKAQDFDIEDIVFKLYSDYEYFGYDCDVSLSSESGDHLSEKLVINNAPSQITQTLGLDIGYVIGLNSGESVSGVWFYPATKYHEPVQILLEDRCIALFASGADIPRKYCYAVTSWNYYGEVVPAALYRISRPNDSCKVEKICEIANEYAQAATITDDDIIYVATDQALYSVTLEGEVTKIEVPEAWGPLYITSMVEFEGSIYIGTHCGILRYTPDTDTFTWFPVEYEDIIPK